MFKKLGRNLAVWSLILAMTLSGTTIVRADETSAQTEAEQTGQQEPAADEETQTPATKEDGQASTAKKQATKKEKQPELCKQIKMEPGDTYDMALQGMMKNAEISVSSDHPGVVKAASNGKLTAKKCGTAVVTAKLTSKGKTSCVKATVKVKYDRYMRKVESGRLLLAGKQTSIKLKKLEKDAKVTYRSSNAKVASVTGSGVITGRKAGTAKIRVMVKQNGKKYAFCEKIHVKDKKKTRVVSSEDRNKWFSHAGFVGNSIGEGLRTYFNAQKSGYLGNPTMMVRKCYSFANDKSKSTTYKVQYKGVPYKASIAVKKSGAKRVFVNMGLNDLWESAEGVYKRYVAYLDEIRKESPGIVIFIESTTPIVKGREKGNLCNKNVDRLNQMMQKYCASTKDTYYIDVSTCLKDSGGYLATKYSCDGYVHLNSAAYANWMNALCKYTDSLMIQEAEAKDAVRTAESSRTQDDYKQAGTLVQGLEKSTVKSDLNARLKKVQKDCRKKAAKADSRQKSKSREVDADSEQDKPLNQTEIKKITAKSNTSLQLTWKSRKGAGYYRIYRANTKKGKYKEIAGTKKTSYTDKNCKKNRKYYYKIETCVSKKNTSRNSGLSGAAAGQTKNEPKKVVFAGDSITEGLKAYDQVKNITTPGKKSVVAYRGLGTLTFQTKNVSGGETAVDLVLDRKPDRLYLMLGMNEVSYRSQQDMYDDYSEIIQAIQGESPKTEIVLLAVAPVTRNAIQKNKGFKKIASWNRKVKKLAKKYNCYYLDCSSALADSQGYLKYDGGDGIHWNVKGYQAYIKQIMKFEKKING